MKKAYEKPNAQILEFDLKENLMTDDGFDMGEIPDVSQGVEDDW